MRRDFRTAECWDEALETALDLLTEGLATVEELQAAAVARRALRPLIGQVAIKTRRLTTAQVFQVLDRQAETGRPFGEIAVELGFMDAAILNDLLRLQIEQTPSLAEVLVSQGVITPEQAAGVHDRIRCRTTGLAAQPVI